MFYEIERLLRRRLLPVTDDSFSDNLVELHLIRFSESLLETHPHFLAMICQLFDHGGGLEERVSGNGKYARFVDGQSCGQPGPLCEGLRTESDLDKSLQHPRVVDA